MRKQTVAIVAIGDEILNGQTLNTNAQLLAKALSTEGYTVGMHQVVSDDINCIQQAFRQLFDSYDIVISTGGLGPTLDDKTKKGFAACFSLTLEKNMSVYEKLLSKSYAENIAADQSYIPQGVETIDNPLGSASCMTYHYQGKLVVLLPGVPSEVDAILPSVIKKLKQDFPIASVPKTKKMTFLHKGEQDLAPVLQTLSEHSKNLQIGIYPSYGFVQVVLKSNYTKVLTVAADSLVQVFPTCYVHNDLSLVMGLKDSLTQKKLTLSLAESCTGGRIAHEITRHAGASDYFLGGVVAYSNKIKQSILGVSTDILSDKGAVSKECALAMAKGALEHFQTDVSIAVTGIAGPTGGSAIFNKPVGTVYAAFGLKEEDSTVFQVPVKKRHISSRKLLIDYVSHWILGALYRILRYGKSDDIFTS